MKLNLTIESDSLHRSLIERLQAIANFSFTLDAAEAELRRVATAHFWTVTRGGHHIALNYVSVYGSTRAAMIAEAA